MIEWPPFQGVVPLLPQGQLRSALLSCEGLAGFGIDE